MAVNLLFQKCSRRYTTNRLSGNHYLLSLHYKEFIEPPCQPVFKHLIVLADVTRIIYARFFIAAGPLVPYSVPVGHLSLYSPPGGK
jgi:hypothetical protein